MLSIGKSSKRGIVQVKKHVCESGFFFHLFHQDHVSIHFVQSMAGQQPRMKL
jgi:hypothetical protein